MGKIKSVMLWLTAVITLMSCAASKMKNDAYYAEHLTLWMDVKIVLKTIKTVLFRENINH